VLAFAVLIPVSGETPEWVRLPRNIGQFANPVACRLAARVAGRAVPRCEPGTARAAAPAVPAMAHSPASAAHAATLKWHA
jgi:hypothetical protein